MRLLISLVLFLVIFLFWGIFSVAEAATLINTNGNAQASTQRNIVKTSDGTLHTVIVISTGMTCGGSSRTGLLYLTSSDEGTNWTCQAQIVASSGYNASLAVDSGDNIYLVYGVDSTGGSASNDIFFRKFTKGAGSTWSVGSAQTMLDSTSSSTAYSYPVVEVEGTSRLWVATRSLVSSNYQLEAYYSSNLGTAPTWTQSAVLTTGSSTNTEHIPTIVRYGTNIGVFYSTSSVLKWKTRADSDGLTSWSSESDVISGSGTIGDKFSAAVDASGNVHAVMHSSNGSSTPGPIKYNYFNGSSWGTAFDLATSSLFAVNTGSVRVTTDGTSVYVFYPDRTGFSGPTDIGRIVYKKGVSPFGSGNFDTNPTALVSSQKVFDKVWRFTSSGSTYADVTTAAGNTTTADVTFPSAVDDILYVGMTERFRAFNPFLSTNGTVGTVSYEYWNGSTWTSLTTSGTVNSNFTSCTSSSTAAACGIWFDPPSDWATTAVNSEETAYYYIRAKVTGAYTITPVGTQLRALDKISNISTPNGLPGQTKVYALWNENINTTTPINVMFSSLSTTANNSPSAPTSLGPTGVVDGSDGTDTTPDFSFSLVDSDGADTVKFQIQIDDTSDFSTPIVDYTSGLGAQGTFNFTVGQAAGSGSYTTGTEGQTLSDASYYWRVRTIDNNGAIGVYTVANSGAVAFSVDNSAPSTPGTPSTTSPTTDTTPTWTWTASTDSHSGLASPAYTVEWSTDSSFTTGVNESTAASNTFTHSDALDAGVWYFRVTATNGVGLTAVSSSGTVNIAGTNSIALGSITTTATFNSIGIQLDYVGDTDQDAEASVRFKKSSDSSWRNGLPMWETNDGTTPSFFGSVVLLDSATAYDIEVTVSDEDGVIGTTTATATQTTRTDNISTAEAVWSAAETKYYVRADGDDSNDGLSEAGAWATIEKAITTAPSGAVVQVGPGNFAAPTTIRTSAITLLAQYPAVNDSREIINDGQRTLIEPPAVAGPTGSSDTDYTAPWTEETPDGDADHPVWKWTGSPVTTATQLMYLTSRNGTPTRVASWRNFSGDATTASQFATKLYENSTYNYGFWPDGTDIYLRMPEDLNPNDYYIKASSGNGIMIDAANSRISGFELHGFLRSIDLLKSSSNAVVDHNLIYNAQNGVRTIGNATSTFSTDVVIQYNRFMDSSMWGTDQTNGKVIPWNFVKLNIKDGSGNSYSTGDIGVANETSAITGRGGAKRQVIRYNTIIGPFNGVGTGINTGYDRYASQDVDIHDNYIAQIADDAIEPETQTINMRAWNNTAEYTSTFVSTGPVDYGPLYIFRNKAWNTGNRGAGRDASGAISISPVFFKYAGASGDPPPRLYVINNTLFSDQSTFTGLTGGANYVDSGSADPDAFYLYNNIITASRSAWEVVSGAILTGTYPNRWIEDYNYFYTSDAIAPGSRGLRYGGTHYTTNVAGYRTASGRGEHTNTVGDFITFNNSWLTNTTTGDISLAQGSPFINLGTTVANIADQTSQYNGSAPDLGATESNYASSNNSSSSSSSSSQQASTTNNSCSASVPIGAPDLFQIDTTSDTAVVYFAPVIGAVSHYEIQYGPKGQDWLYSTNGWGSGVEIKQLPEASEFNFRMRAFNDCVPGTWSNSITVKTLPKNAKQQIAKYYKSLITVTNNSLQINSKGKSLISVPLPQIQKPSPQVSEPEVSQPAQPTQDPEVVTSPVSSQVPKTSWFNSVVTAVKRFFGF